ncbi:hypothetical protein EDD66_101197 [Mobilisporobacter senegalensis]|uniref:Uncharacterized protein n=1 Tax=Mobilisporobacter senegalensis TaxID=1329262 RepID=A0A3N1XYB8_9FIRM|nr:hypothetical protein [Mobilisporobacter senegalensis]ROR31580.1 hypothetical protein EDD66_101197 [Mobilisporobacter senegalensis]
MVWVVTEIGINMNTIDTTIILETTMTIDVTNMAIEAVVGENTTKMIVVAEAEDINLIPQTIIHNYYNVSPS